MGLREREAISSRRGGERISSQSKARIQSFCALSAASFRKVPNPLKRVWKILTFSYFLAMARVWSVDPVSRRMISGNDFAESRVDERVSWAFFERMQRVITS